MCSPKAPAQTTVVTPPPAVAPQPMALAEPQDGSTSLSQLRIGSKANAKLRAPVAPAAGPGLRIPTAPTPPASA